MALTKVANTGLSGYITSSLITSVANTAITGNIIASQITSVANTQVTGVLTVAQGGSGASSFATPVGTVRPLVFYDGSNLATDTTVIDIGYDTSNHILRVNNVDTYGNVAIGGNISVQAGMIEKANVSASGMGANITVPFNNGGVLYFTQNSSANATINFTGLSGMGVGNVSSYAVMVTNNTSPKYIATVQVDGDGTANITTKWSGGAPTSGTANIDTYAFNVIKTAATPAYTVLASVSNYK